VVVGCSVPRSYRTTLVGDAAMSDVLPCIICGFQPESALPNSMESENQPYKATVFTSYGQYGSTVIDTMGEYFIELNICDKCLRERKHNVREGRITRKTEHHYEAWDPDKR
jgi:hypothetical protein